jgi:hypothetical protein
MRVYTERPTARRARAVWDHATRLRGKEPTALWKNPNCWGASLQVTGNAWGWWYAEFGSHRDTEPINPHDVQ